MSKKLGNAEYTSTEIAIGNVFKLLFKMKYYFYIICSVVGIVAYFLHLDKLLFVMTALCLAVYLFGVLAGRSTFKSGLLWLPAGGYLGYLFDSELVRGVCLGILLTFVIRHMLRSLLMRFYSKLIELGNK